MRQLLTESIVLALIGGVAGLVASYWAIKRGYPEVLSRVPLPSGFTDAFTINLNPDWRVFAYTLAASMADPNRTHVSHAAANNGKSLGCRAVPRLDSQRRHNSWPAGLSQAWEVGDRRFEIGRHGTVP